jgi:hypothetical protein
VLPLLLAVIGLIDGRSFAGVPFARVRSSNPVLASRLVDAYRRSPTIQHLIDALCESDVIVYVEDGRCALAACTTVRTGGNAQRYVRITVRQTETPDRLIVQIGHELRHALEIAAEPGTTDADALRRLYHRIGYEYAGMTGVFETHEAQRVSDLIASELAAPKGALPASTRK